MRAVRHFACAGIIMLALPLAAFAQQTVDYGSIGGQVTDPSGAVVQGARVSARHHDTNVVTTTVTDDEGRFRFPFLKIGPYDVVVRQQGFQDASRRLTLTVGSAFELPVGLTVGPLDAAVTVTGRDTIIDAARSQIAGTVSQAEVRTLPLNGRNFLEIALLVPGVSPTNVASTQLFPETSAVPGISLSVNSQRNLSNNFIVDGLSANDDAAALSGMTYGVDAIEQFQVVTSGGQAELGRALGGYVNIVTRSGTNLIRGTAYDYVRDDRFNASNPLSGTKLPMSQSQYGVSLGGPLLKDRTFYFVNAEHRGLDQSGLTTISPANAAALNARLAAVGYQGPAIATGVYPNPVDSTNVLAKIDHQANGRDQLGVRYALYDIASENARGAGGLNAPSASSGLDNIDQTISASNTLTMSPRTVLETRVQFADSHLKAPPSDPMGPAVSVAGVASFGTLSSSPTARANRLVQVVNSLSHQAGAHAFRVGADLLYNDDRITFPRAIRGAYTFSSLANFMTGVYNNAGFTQTFGDTVAHQTNPNVGVYAQDEWKLASNVTLNAGRAIRPSIPRDNRHRSRQRLATCRLRLVPVRLAPDIDSRQCWTLLRSRAAARAGERAVVGRQYNGPDRAAPDCRQPLADPGGRAGVPADPRRRHAVRDAAESHHDGSRTSRTPCLVRRASRSSIRSAIGRPCRSAINTFAARTC